MESKKAASGKEIQIERIDSSGRVILAKKND